MPIVLETFSGTVPALHKRLLPQERAQVAQNVQFDRGTIRPVLAPRDAHTLAADAQTIIPHGGSWLGFDAIVNATPGPVATDRLYITGDGVPKLWDGTAFRTLALPAPTALPSVTPAGHPSEDDAVAESTVFAYTWVTDLGEESPPSPLSGAFSMTSTEGATIGGFDNAWPTGRGVEKIRIYRSQTSLSGNTTLHFVAEFTIADPQNIGSYVHDPASEPINEEISTADYDVPPDDLEGIIAMPNGMLVAFSGRELCFCEPFQPHAWPIKYRLKVDYPIMGLAAFSTMLAIVTTGTPYRAEGTHPELVQMERIEANLPCVAKRSVVDLGYAAVYASTEGVAMITAQGAQNITGGVLTKEQWDALTPSGFVAVRWQGRYMVSHQPVGAGTRQLSIFDFRGEAPYITTSPVAALDLVEDITTAKVYALTGARSIVEYDGDTTQEATAIWRSKLFQPTYPMSFGVAHVQGDASALASPSHALRVYADGVLKHTSSALNEAIRLPSGFRSRNWEIEIEGNASINRVVLAEDLATLGQI